jgi:hypothetical protein
MLPKEAGHEVHGPLVRQLVSRHHPIIKKLGQQSTRFHQQRTTAVEVPQCAAIERILGEIVVQHNFFTGKPLNVRVNECLTDQWLMAFDQT